MGRRANASKSSAPPARSAGALEFLKELRLFPIRHHSPRSSAVLEAFLDRVQPTHVLVEGPSDANHLIEVLLDPETRPPIAVLGYRTDGTPGSAAWPFASYSPEYVALAWSKRRGVEARFIDLPVGQSLALRRDDHGPTGEGSASSELPSLEESAARARGLRSFEELWEACYEAPAHDDASFRAAILAYADVVRASPIDRAHSAARDAHMVRRIGELVQSGVPPESIAVVAGAAHIAAFAAGEVDPAREAEAAATVPSALTLIPYSFPRLAEQLGYGAGNRAPQYYQRAHDAGCDFRRATLEVLVEIGEHLRLRGFMASLADTIEAYRLATALADLRGKPGPGLDEVREAVTATLCRGDAAQVDQLLWSATVGKNVGRVASRIGKNSLQEEFWRELQARKLPSTDAPEKFTLRLNNEVEVATSVFLHRLRVAGVPYAGYVGREAGSRATRAEEQEAGGYAALVRVRETWEAQWTPATDIALVERIVLGETLEQVAEKSLGERLGAAKTTGEAADVLLDAVVTASAATTHQALMACERLAASDDHLPSLATATRALSALVSYGSSRARSSLGDRVLAPMLTKTFARAVLRAPDAAVGDDDAMAEVKPALRTLHEVALSQPIVDQAAWLDAARAIAESWTVNPACAGLAAGLLYLAQKLSETAVAELVRLRLTSALEPERAAGFLEGFLEVNALVLVKSRPVVEVLDGFLASIEAARFKDIVPLLRRAFSALGATERRYLLENVLAIRRLGDKAGAAKAVIREQDKEKLKAISGDLAQAMDDLDDLL